METKERTISVLNQLLKINNDRSEGFSKAAEALGMDDIDLKSILTNFAFQSDNNAKDIKKLVVALGGNFKSRLDISGTLHHAWLKAEALFSGNDRKAILTECERGEDYITTAYSNALQNEYDLEAEAIKLLKEQQVKLVQANGLIRQLRDEGK